MRLSSFVTSFDVADIAVAAFGPEDYFAVVVATAAAMTVAAVVVPWRETVAIYQREVRIQIRLHRPRVHSQLRSRRLTLTSCTSTLLLPWPVPAVAVATNSWLVSVGP